MSVLFLFGPDLSAAIAALAVALVLTLAIAAAIPPLRTLPAVIGGAAIACLPALATIVSRTCTFSLTGLAAAVVAAVLCVVLVHAGVAIAAGASTDELSDEPSIGIVASLLATWLLLQSTIVEDALALSSSAICHPVDLQLPGQLLLQGLHLVPSLLVFRLALDVVIACISATRGSAAASPLQSAARLAPALLVIWLLQHPEELLTDIHSRMHAAASVPR